MSKLSRISRVIKFSTKRKIYDDDASKFRPYLTVEFENKEQSLSTLFISTRLTSRRSIYSQYYVKKRGRCLSEESYVNIKFLLKLSLSSAKVEKKIKQCYHCSPACLEKEEFEEIVSLQEIWAKNNQEISPITLKEKDLENLR